MCLVAVLVFYFFSTALATESISGSVELHASQPAIPSNVRITVYSNHGELVEAVSIKADGTFTLYSLPLQPHGNYILYVIGNTVREYTPLLVRLQEGSVKSVLHRRRSLLVVPADDDAWPDDTEIKFMSHAKTNYEQKREPWRWTDIWLYKYRFLQLAAVVFIVWFPQVIKDLPKEMREELMGEEPDLGDPNAHFKALIGRSDVYVSTTGRQQT